MGRKGVTKMPALFTFQQIASLNETEIQIYNYIIKHMEATKHMSIRTLAEETHVSVATVNRFCHKMECDGYSEFKLQLKIFDEMNRMPEVDDEITMLNNFFEYTKLDEFKGLINKAVEAIRESETILFLGIGQSGSLAHYGARQFSNVGFFSYSIDDPFYPAPVNPLKKRTLIVLSMSGETKEMIDQIRNYQKMDTYIITITNKEDSTMALMSDLVIPYYIKYTTLPGIFNISSAVPTVYIIERIERGLEEVRNSQLDHESRQ